MKKFLPFTALLLILFLTSKSSSFEIKQVGTFKGLTDGIDFVMFSPDGKFLISKDGGWNKTIRFWDVRSMKPIKEFWGKNFKTLAINSRFIFSSDGRFLAAGGDRIIYIWNLKSGIRFRTIHAHKSWIQSLAFSPDGKILASGSQDKTINLWNAEKGTLIKTFTGHMSWVNNVIFAPEGKLLASASIDGTIKLWDVQTGKLLQTIKMPKTFAMSLHFLPHKDVLVSLCADKVIRLWSIYTGKLTKTLNDKKESAWSISLSQDGQYLALNGANPVKIWNLNTGMPFKVQSEKNTFEPSAAFSPDGKLFALGACKKFDKMKQCCIKGYISLWDINKQVNLKVITVENGTVASMAFSPDGKTFASAVNSKKAKGCTIKLWKITYP